jgi:hypothetical protein
MSGASGPTARRDLRDAEFEIKLPVIRYGMTAILWLAADCASFGQMLAWPASEQFGHFRFQSIGAVLRGRNHWNVGHQIALDDIRRIGRCR